jgi:hypothetical protein
MEIKLIDGQKVFIKGKKESVIVNPDKGEKQPARVWIFTKLKDLIYENNDKVMVAGPGEYEVGGIDIMGTKIDNEGLFYTLNIDGIRVGLVDEMKEELTEKKMGKIGEVDVLIFRLGESDGKMAKIIMALAKKMGANYVLPFGCSPQSESLKSFLDETDNEGKEPLDSLKIDKDELPDGMEVVILK